MQASDQKNIAIVSNRLAGAGRSMLLVEKIVTALSAKNISHSLFIDKWPDHFENFTDAFIVGGDGTLHYFINKYPDIKLPLVLFNGGTANDFHWLLYGKMSFEKQLQLGLANESKPVDLGHCNEKYFLNDAGIGFGAEVTKGLLGKKKLPGKRSFMIMVLKKIFTYRSRLYRMWVDDDPVITKTFLMIDVNNGRRAGGGFHIAPEARPDDGWFDIVAINALSPLSRLRWLPVIEKGRHLNRSFIFYKKAKKVVVESDRLIEAHLDGEFYTAEKMEIGILPGKLLFRY